MKCAIGRRRRPCTIIHLIHLFDMYMYKKYKFEKLDIYHLGNDFVVEIYKLTKKFPKEELFGLISQIKRAVISVVLNIAEGSGKNTKKDFAKFISQSIGSLLEVKACLILAGKLEYITRDAFDKILPKLDELYFKLQGFKKFLEKND